MAYLTAAKKAEIIEKYQHTMPKSYSIGMLVDEIAAAVAAGVGDGAQMPLQADPAALTAADSALDPTNTGGGVGATAALVADVDANFVKAEAFNDQVRVDLAAIRTVVIALIDKLVAGNFMAAA